MEIFSAKATISAKKDPWLVSPDIPYFFPYTRAFPTSERPRVIEGEQLPPPANTTTSITGRSTIMTSKSGRNSRTSRRGRGRGRGRSSSSSGTSRGSKHFRVTTLVSSLSIDYYALAGRDSGFSTGFKI